MNEKSIGIVGVGLLGAALAERLLESGYCVVGHDLDPQRMQILEASGGQCAHTLADVAACDRIILSLPTTQVVEQVVQEFGRQLRGGTILIDTTTGDPEAVAILGASLIQQEVHYLDATISGSSAEARRGEVTVMAGGERAAFDACEDLFGCFAKQRFHLGPWGSGSKMKLVTNLVLGLNRAVLAEGLALAWRMGLPLTQTLEVLGAGAAYSRALDIKGDKMVRGEFSVQARLSQHLKDVRLISAAGQRAGAKLPFTALHRELLESLELAGFGNADNSAVIRAFLGEGEPFPDGGYSANRGAEGSGRRTR